MFFQKMRRQMKVVIIIVVVAMAGGLLWAGGMSLFGSRSGEQPTLAAAATVNGEVITNYDLQYTFLNRLRQIEQEQGILPASSYEAVKFQALQALIETVIIRQEIRNRNLTASQEEIEAELQNIIDQFASVEDYQRQLELVGLTEAVLKGELAEEIKFKKLKKEIIGDLPVEEWEIQEAYEKVRPSHILIRPEGGAEDDWAAAEAQAWEVFALADADNFAELARQYSADASSERDGDLGYITRGRTVPEFEEAAFALQVSEISEPVRSQYGYHIIMVTDRKDAEGEEFEKARPLIEDALREEKGMGDLTAWFKQEREAAEIVYVDFQMSAREQVQAGNFEDAIHYYRLAIEEQPNNGYLHASLGDVYEEMGSLEEAINQYKLAIEKFSDDNYLHMALGDLYRQAELTEEAAAAYLKASELAPNDIFNQLTAYNNLNRLERYEDAAVVEERISAFQERQAEMLKEREEAAAQPVEPDEEEPAEKEPAAAD